MGTQQLWALSEGNHGWDTHKATGSQVNVSDHLRTFHDAGCQQGIRLAAAGPGVWDMPLGNCFWGALKGLS